MRPLFRGLFVLSVFGLVAAHVASGLLREFFAGSPAGSAALGLLDSLLRGLLIEPFGRPAAVNVILVAGAAAALWAMVAGQRDPGRSVRHSTW